MTWPLARTGAKAHSCSLALGGWGSRGSTECKAILAYRFGEIFSSKQSTTPRYQLLMPLLHKAFLFKCEMKTWRHLHSLDLGFRYKQGELLHLFLTYRTYDLNENLGSYFCLLRITNRNHLRETEKTVFVSKIQCYAVFAARCTVSLALKMTVLHECSHSLTWLMFWLNEGIMR